MRKQLSILFFLLILMLAACQSRTPDSNQVIPSPSLAISSTVASEPTFTTTSEPPGSGAPPGCSVVSQDTTSDPSTQSLFPPGSDKDWSFGLENAAITLIEYSDFQ